MRAYWILLVFLISACSPGPELNIAGNHWLGYQPYYLAADSQWSESGTRVRANFTQLSSTTHVLRVLANGQLDGALLTLDEAITFEQRADLGLCVAMVLSASKGADALVVNPDIVDPDSGDFSNLKTIGYESSALGGYMFRRIKEKLALDENRVVSRLLQPASHFRALSEGQVDGVITFEPYLSKLLQAGFKVAFDSTDISGEIIDILVMREDVWRNNKRSVQQVIWQYWPVGLNLLEQRRASDTTTAALQANTGLQEPALSLALNKMSFYKVKESQAYLRTELKTLSI
ncbi:ABC transporter substrate-binding protein [Lacimicrobium alkaliphilum]|uniref:SsuA/THI5-like domain-containing protein n=1 Tax=Lacimicrobium alkaliphilum TaxID=1526571 RepID=A0A0U3AH51_9ALTE|nr:ABC transporter substrate-binding protein [Lacimicrobium alkaliphilum]ALS97378.1 hypothetical protein AT746_03200 [Lacimicrobium alkaliphilum]